MNAPHKSPSSSRTARLHNSPTRLAALFATAFALVLATLSPGTPPAEAAMGGDRFWAGKVYRGEFGAPSIIRVGRTYYAYATTADGNHLPLMTSKNLRTWRARKAWPQERSFSTWKGYNDAMPFPARWGAKRGRKTQGVWAPAVAELGGQYVNAYAVQMRGNKNRHCLTLATSPRPAGPFRDTSTKPLYCSSDPNGSIDPAWLVLRGKVYLIWKNAGVPGGKPTQIVGRRMTDDGLRFKPGSRIRVLLQTKRPWEGNVIEAPSLIAHKGRIYLFYSGNIYRDSRYAIGYATCKGPLGPCKRGSKKPLLATGGKVAGPGAQSPLIDKKGRLRLAYSAWDRGRVGYPTSKACRQTAAGCNQRKLHIATLKVGRHGKLSVTRRG